MLTQSLHVLVTLTLASAALACTSGGPSSDRSSGPVVEASGPEAGPAVPTEALASLDKVYVPLSGNSLLSLDGALAEKGYGNVKSSDFRPQFEYAEADFGPAVVAYSSGDWIPGESLFQPMSVTQWLEAALSDDAASGAVINPGHTGQSLALTKTQISEALSRLPRQSPLPMEIYITQ